MSYSLFKIREQQAFPWQWLLIAGGLILLLAGAPVAISKLRGIRNNNPGNIERTSVKWKGMAADQPDERFIKFVAPEWGIRAMARILRGDILEGTDTIRALIHEWAPPTENITTAYVDAVAKALKVLPDARLTVLHLKPLIAAIIKHENGSQPYSDAILQKGIDLERSA